MTPAAAVVTTSLAPRHRGLRDAALAALRRLVPAGTRCALIDFPTSANVGDSAIWLGARSLLDEAGASVVYLCDRHSFSADHLDTALAPGGTILISGGGNLGDLWPAHQRFRELASPPSTIAGSSSYPNRSCSGSRRTRLGRPPCSTPTPT